ncbi:MAG: hypothetical protein ABFR89_02370 [Actinomycetota bacterium]
MPKPLTLRTLQEIPARAKVMLREAEGEDGVVDLLGEFRAVERGLASLRQTAASELESQTHGRRWKIVVPAPNKRSFNTPRLVAKFSRATGESLFDTIMLLLREKALSISWTWTNLERVADKYDVSLTIARHEITDGDDADVGVVKGRGTPSYEPVDE